MEKAFERLIFAARWLMAPMYLGLVGVLGRGGHPRAFHAGSC